MREMEKFLVQFPRLKYLELQAEAISNIANGDRWKVLICSLKTFRIKFDVQLPDIKQIRKSFRTSFWIHEKHWFIAYNQTFLMSIPYFTLDTINSSCPPDIYTTALNHSIVLDRVQKFVVDDSIIIPKYRLGYIKSLVLNGNVTVGRLESMVDLTRVEHLTVMKLNQLLMFIPLEQKMPRLIGLTINTCFTADSVKPLRGYRFEQMLKLTVTVSNEHSDYIFEELFRLFPCIEYFRENLFSHSNKTIIRCLDAWKHLSNGTFSTPLVKLNPQITFDLTQDMVLKQSRRLTKENFTYQIYCSKDWMISYHWWIDEQVHCFLIFSSISILFLSRS